jgi:hypothetical protein
VLSILREIWPFFGCWDVWIEKFYNFHSFYAKGQFFEGFWDFVILRLLFLIMKVIALYIKL